MQFVRHAFTDLDAYVDDNSLRLTDAAADNLAVPPAVTLAIPSNAINWKICVPASITLSAQAVAGSYNIRKVEYYDGAVLIGQSSNAPAFKTMSLGLTQGVHQITARAVDVMGLRATSLVAQVTLTWPALHELLAELNTNRDVVCCMGALLGSNYVVETSTFLQNGSTMWQPYFTNQMTWTNLVFTNHPVELQRYYRARFWQ